MKIILENVRCFSRRQEIPVKPITLLVGENSSGKSTFLAMLSAMTHPESNFPEYPNFSLPPFELGGYDTIATYKGGKGGRAKSFKLGYIEEQEGETQEVQAEYGSRDGRIRLKKLCVEDEANTLRLEFQEPDYRKFSGSFITDKTNHPKETLMSNSLPDDRFGLREIFFYAVVKAEKEQKIKLKLPFSRIPFVRGKNFSGFDIPIPSMSIAPIRTKPKRTYDQLSELFSPEGEHIPALLAETFQGDESKNRKSVIEAIKKFGKEAGLFEDVETKLLGRNIGAPFQIMFTLEGKPRNLVDIGYGVSQVLPVIMQSLVAGRRRILLQQPEVHLHPKAQAAIGTFFVDIAAAKKTEFVIETHSDFILDRIRIEVANKKISPEDVVILFFERKGYETTVHIISLDDIGNISHAPPSYRKFFLKEELNLFYRSSVLNN